MSTLTEITGQLIGGPDDGNVVTSSVTEIPVTSTVYLWLDGHGEGKTPTVVLYSGKYKYLADRKYFIWQSSGVEIIS